MVSEDMVTNKIGQSVAATTILIGTVDSELDYWTSYQRDVMRAARLTDELRDLRARADAENFNKEYTQTDL